MVEKNKEQSLENLVSYGNLKNSEFKERRGMMYRVIHDQEIRFVEVKNGLYTYAGIHYVGKGFGRYEEREEWL